MFPDGAFLKVILKIPLPRQKFQSFTLPSFFPTKNIMEKTIKINKCTYFTQMTMVPWKWFEQYEDSGSVRRRGDEYEGLKKTLGHKMVDQLCRLYPHLR